MSRYKSRFEKMVRDLENNERVSITDVVFNDPADADEIAEVKESFPDLPPDLENFYREMNGFELEWEHEVEEIKEGNQSDSGLIRLLPVGEVFGDWEDAIWFDEDETVLRKIIPFDFFVAEACAALYPRLEGETGVHYHYCGEELHPTGLSFSSYIERLLASRGFWYWLTTLCVDLQNSTEASEFRKKMPLIFDDYDDAPFRPIIRAGEIDIH